MVRCFLSHSSKDKKSYVEIVAKRLGFHNCVYDDFTFEEGMQPLEEILKWLDKSDIFVIFLSESSLKSDWVKLEITEAHKALKAGDIRRIFPIIIDSNITYQDERIPQWMRDEYNLKYVSRPTVASRRIGQRLREIGWELHPRIRDKNKIFVGRNQLISSFEERVDNFDKPKPLCVIASGIKEIGRKTLLRSCYIKSNLIDESYELPLISLNSQDSLEDFIYQLNDFGLSAKYDLTNFLHKSIEEKIQIAIKIVTDIQNVKEIISIEDNGCIVTVERKIADWFLRLLEGVKRAGKLTFSIASSYRLLKHTVLHEDSIYSIDVPELERAERNGLLKRYSEFEGLNLSRDDFAFFSGLLSGYPGQIFYAVDLIKNDGVNQTKRNSTLIGEFSSTKAQRLLERYENDLKKMDFLYLLSEFNFISYDFLFEIVEENEGYYRIIDDLLASAVCELLGANGEYIRLNDTVRDYVRRNRFVLPEDYKIKLQEHLDGFLRTYTGEEKDASDFFYSLKKGEHPSLADIPEQARYRLLKGQSRSSQRRDRKQEKSCPHKQSPKGFLQEHVGIVLDAIANKKSLDHNGGNPGADLKEPAVH
jgi:hypothetical protein